ncbi:DL-endopeptidase inhibitor IseA family protein [Bacillus sp. DTU_2020_1000418_1_SI_GHA_SEK_038]|uniref:DL-endopeptidase inhibitor IseA family protein n=1 Tax=Bacillus sp. DTU_2020_1000418_1_SI_GHA_SEK_038 TaxID=3077585 RepID=UPI0028EDB6FF|nr:DL-endopeptidase inhibitor IseA family protein [Bacillus sp. DTU_2020_1000418_1_SI_GHA_SEK_038]WNS76700.1 DL-endopeptidase inhibitor IseA family protein [Bacillus sp. DTU_2020_1000418_1_SI_GHA_SEK_038]
MGKYRLRYSALLLASSFFLGGCNFLPEPVTLLQAPQYAEAASEIEKTLLLKSKEFLPAGMVFTTASQPVGIESAIQADLNGDGENEVVYLYQSIGKQDQSGALILRKEKGEWKKERDVKGTGYEVSWASSADITGDGRPELLLGWKIGVSAGNILDIFTWDPGQHGGLVKLAQLNYHELEVLIPEDKKDSQARLAVWNREMADVYKTDLVKWENNSFQSDLSFYPAYFAKVADYYDTRANNVPNAPYYWYYLADARLREGHPELALQAIENGMNLKITFPSRDEFKNLKMEIKEKLAHLNSETLLYYLRDADITMDIPKALASSLFIKDEEGNNSEYMINVNKVLDNGQTEILFTVEVHQKDWISSLEEYGLSPLFETKTLTYGVRKNNEFFHDPVVGQIVSSIRPGADYKKLKSQEEQMLLEMVQTAVKKYWYVTSGGKIEEGLIESFLLNEMDYRYMGSDLDSKEKVNEYLSSTYSAEAIHQYMERAGIVLHNGKLAQPNADGGSRADYERATIFLTKDAGSEKEYNLKVPLGDSLVTETVHIVFRQTDKGWKIDSIPGSF